MMAAPGHRGSHRTLAVLLHNDAVLGQLLLDENDLFLTFDNEITTCTQKQTIKELFKGLRLHADFIQAVSEGLPGSKGHSFSLENSMGVLPVSTQLELRNIIGILKGKSNHFFSDC